MSYIDQTGPLGRATRLWSKATEIEEPDIDIGTPKVNLGSDMAFTVELNSNSQTSQKIVIDDILHFQKTNGTLSPKVFKWKQLNLQPSEEIILERRHAIRSITTRKYYSGEHALYLRINGTKFGRELFDLAYMQMCPAGIMPAGLYF